MRDRRTVEGRPTAHVCRNFTCELPNDDPQQAPTTTQRMVQAINGPTRLKRARPASIGSTRYPHYVQSFFSETAFALAVPLPGGSRCLTGYARVPPILRSLASGRTRTNAYPFSIRAVTCLTIGVMSVSSCTEPVDWFRWPHFRYTGSDSIELAATMTGDRELEDAQGNTLDWPSR